MCVFGFSPLCLAVTVLHLTDKHNAKRVVIERAKPEDGTTSLQVSSPGCITARVAIINIINRHTPTMHDAGQIGILPHRKCHPAGQHSILASQHRADSGLLLPHITAHAYGLVCIDLSDLSNQWSRGSRHQMAHGRYRCSLACSPPFSLQSTGK